MKKIAVFILLILVFGVTAFSENTIDEKIREDLNLEDAVDKVPESVVKEADFSPSGTPSENGLTPAGIFKYVFNLTFSALGEEIYFLLSFLSLIVISSLAESFIDGLGNGGVKTALHFATSSVISSLLIVSANNAFALAIVYVEELSSFVVGLLPFIGSISLAGGQITSSVVTGALIISAIDFLEILITEIAIPISRIILAFSIVGYVSRMPLGALSEFLSGAVTKLVTLSFGILCAIIYFQNSVTAVTDSLALRSVKLAAGSFIPIVGGFVSEASGTLLSGVRLVKSTFGVFAVAVLLYMMIRPLVNFGIKKLTLKFIKIISRLVGADKEGSVVSEMLGVYNILSATMIASSCYFIFAIAVFIKSEVG